MKMPAAGVFITLSKMYLIKYKVVHWWKDWVFLASGTLHSFTNHKILLKMAKNLYYKSIVKFGNTCSQKFTTLFQHQNYQH